MIIRMVTGTMKSITAVNGSTSTPMWNCVLPRSIQGAVLPNAPPSSASPKAMPPARSSMAVAIPQDAIVAASAVTTVSHQLRLVTRKIRAAASSGGTGINHGR